MNYTETMLMMDFLAKAIREIGLPPMYKWNIPNTWDEYEKWAKFLGYKAD